MSSGLRFEAGHKKAPTDTSLSLALTSLIQLTAMTSEQRSDGDVGMYCCTSQACVHLYWLSSVLRSCSFVLPLLWC